MNCAQVYVVRTTGTPFHVKQALGPYGICRRRGVQNPDQGLLASKESPRKRSYPAALIHDVIHRLIHRVLYPTM
jgi:hypothetical protein